MLSSVRPIFWNGQVPFSKWAERMPEPADCVITAAPQDPEDISARPALVLANSFQLLVLRQFLRCSAPLGIAFVDQALFRRPDRPSRHGMSFELAFLPDIIAWLIREAGAPYRREGTGAPSRNGMWPQLKWQAEERCWAEDLRTVEWYAEAVFPDETLWTVFRNCWGDRLDGIA